MSAEICAGQGCHRRFGAEGAHLTVVGRPAELSSPPAEDDAHHEGDGKPCQRRLPHTSGENIKRHAGLFCGHDRLAQALRCRLDTVDHLLDGRWSFGRNEVIGHVNNPDGVASARSISACWFLAICPDQTFLYPSVAHFRDYPSTACPFGRPNPNPCARGSCDHRAGVEFHTQSIFEHPEAAARNACDFFNAAKRNGPDKAPRAAVRSVPTGRTWHATKPNRPSGFRSYRARVP
jgi:hypothetical protein